MIFSNAYGHNSSFLLDGIKKILGGIDSCITTTEKINSFSLNPDNRKGLNCLHAMCNEIKEIDSKLISRSTFKR